MPRPDHLTHIRRVSARLPSKMRRGIRLTRRGARVLGSQALEVGQVAAEQALEVGQVAVERVENLANRLILVGDIPLTALAGWRRFVTGPYRRWALIAAGQGIVGALAGASLIVPLLLSLGLSAALVTALATLVLAGPAAQLAVPHLLRAGNGDLRRLTLLAAGIGETRGLWLAAGAVATYLGILPVGGLIFLCALALAAAGICSGVAAANLQAWMAAVLPEADRRFAAPRVGVLVMAAGALTLVGGAVLLTSLGVHPGPGAYAPLFALAGIAGLFELRALVRLRQPGRVIVPHLADAPVVDPAGLRNFLGSAGFASVGSGLAPYMSTYAIVVLGASAGAAVALSAVTAGAAVIAGVLAADLLAHRSSSRFLRASWLAIAGGWLLAFLAAPIFPFALPALFASAVVVAAAAAVGQLAVTERLFRLAPGPAAIAVQGRFVALNAAGTTAGQLFGVGVLALGPAGFIPFGTLFALSAGARFLASRRLQVAASWTTSTTVFRHEELGISGS